MTERKRPRGAQQYKGNGKHEWEYAAYGTYRLRVPGCWIYRAGYEYNTSAVFVPSPNAVGYAI